jgi:hypothetical protein
MAIFQESKWLQGTSPPHRNLQKGGQPPICTVFLSSRYAPLRQTLVAQHQHDKLSNHNLRAHIVACPVGWRHRGKLPLRNTITPKNLSKNKLRPARSSPGAPIFETVLTSSNCWQLSYPIGELFAQRNAQQTTLTCTGLHRLVRKTSGPCNFRE